MPNDNCQGSCSSNCASGTGPCASCANSCVNGCEGDCKGCSGTCSGCTGCTGSCSGKCYKGCGGNCLLECSETCRDTCKGECKGYCAEYCQTYCEKEQVFSKNISPINAAVGKGTFNWTYDVETDKTIKITKSDWNTLKSYIKAATTYCGGTAPSKSNVAENDPITASQYNDLANGLDLTNVTAKETIITANIINKLKNTYNNRKIKDTLPAGKNNNSTGANQCCQTKMTCMASGQFLDHQAMTTCKDGQTKPS